MVPPMGDDLSLEMSSSPPSPGQFGPLSVEEESTPFSPISTANNSGFGSLSGKKKLEAVRGPGSADDRSEQSRKGNANPNNPAYVLRGGFKMPTPN